MRAIEGKLSFNLSLRLSLLKWTQQIDLWCWWNDLLFRLWRWNVNATNPRSSFIVVRLATVQQLQVTRWPRTIMWFIVSAHDLNTNLIYSRAKIAWITNFSTLFYALVFRCAIHLSHERKFVKWKNYWPASHDSIVDCQQILIDFSNWTAEDVRERGQRSESFTVGLVKTFYSKNERILKKFSLEILFESCRRKFLNEFFYCDCRFVIKKILKFTFSTFSPVALNVDRIKGKQCKCLCLYWSLWHIFLMNTKAVCVTTLIFCGFIDRCRAVNWVERLRRSISNVLVAFDLLANLQKIIM